MAWKGTSMKKLRNLDQLSPERRAMLQAMLEMPEGAIVPKKAQPIETANPEDLLSTIEVGVLAQTIGELLEQARMERGIGVRELARRLNLNHARVKQLEDAGRGRSENIEVQSLARLAKALSYKVRIVLEPEEGGRLLEARL
jgi:ribosome-binding protein aMBF1 (putative translation factor)